MRTIDNIIEVKVNGNHLDKDNRNAGVQYEANARKLRIEFGEGWDGFAKTVTFWDALMCNPVSIELTTSYLEDDTNGHIYIVPIPAQAMKEAGEMTFVIDGYSPNGDVRKRSVTDTLFVTEAPEAINPSEPEKPQPNVWEAMQASLEFIMDNIEDAAKAANAVEAAESARDEAEEWAQSAGEDAALAKEKAEAADASATAADLDRQAAEGAKTAAENAKIAAETAQSKAEAAQTAAEGAKTAAETARGKAEEAQSKAETAQSKAETAKGTADAAATTATSKAAEASQSAINAANSESAAAKSVTDAKGWASQARGYVEGIQDTIDEFMDSGIEEAASAAREEVDRILAELEPPIDEAIGYANAAEASADRAYREAERAEAAAERAESGSGVSQAYVDAELKKKFNKTGGVIDGDVVIGDGSLVEDMDGNVEERKVILHYGKTMLGFSNSALEDLSGNEYEYGGGKIKGLENAEADDEAVPYGQMKAELDVVKESVSEGKALIASAVTDKGVTTADDATFEQMAENIGLIGGGELAGDGEEEEVFVTPSKSVQEVEPSAGCVLSKVTVEPIPDEYQDVSGVTATADKVLRGSKFVDAEGKEVWGTIYDHGDGPISVKRLTPNNPVYYVPEGYHHDGCTEVQVWHQSKMVTPSKDVQWIYPDEYYDFIDSVLVQPIPSELQDVSEVDVPNSMVVDGYKFVDKYGAVQEGTMPNNGNVEAVLDTLKTVYDIPAGYHLGNGKVSVKTETREVTPNENILFINPSEGKVLRQVTIKPIPHPYHDVSRVTVTAEQVPDGLYFVDSEGNVVEGTVPWGGMIYKTMSMDGLKATSVVVPAGYYSFDCTISLTDDIEERLKKI